MINKLINKMSNMTAKQWIVSMLWLSTFVLLIVFVILAATMSKGTEGQWANTKKDFEWKFLVVDPKDLVKGNPNRNLVNAPAIDPKTAEEIQVTWTRLIGTSSDFTTYVNFEVAKGSLDINNVDFTKGLINGKQLWNASASYFVKPGFTASLSYANTLAAIGTVFAIGLFSSLTTTVWFAYTNKKGVNNG